MIGPRGLPALMAQRGYRVERIALEAPGPDINALWDYDDPAASEARFRAALADTTNEATHDVALSLRTQIARSFSLRRRFDEAQRELDAVDAELAGAGAGRACARCWNAAAAGARPASRRGRGRSSCRPSSWRALRSWSSCTSTRCTWWRWCRPIRNCSSTGRAGPWPPRAPPPTRRRTAGRPR